MRRCWQQADEALAFLWRRSWRLAFTSTITCSSSNVPWRSIRLCGSPSDQECGNGRHLSLPIYIYIFEQNYNNEYISSRQVVKLRSLRDKREYDGHTPPSMKRKIENNTSNWTFCYSRPAPALGDSSLHVPHQLSGSSYSARLLLALVPRLREPWRSQSKPCVRRC